MGSKKTLPVYYPFSAQAISSTTTYTSVPTSIANLDNLGVQVKFTGTPTGTFSVKVSNDNVQYDALTFNPALTQPTGGTLSYSISLNQLPYQYVEFVYTNASGTGTLTVSLFGKDVN